MNEQLQDGIANGASTEEIRKALSRGGVIDITTTGRQSGRPRRIEIVFHNIGGRLYVSGMPRRERRSWLANLEADPRFEFHLKGPVRADLGATARIITDEAERREVLTQVARNWKRRDVDTMVRYSPLIEATIEGA
jgi:deazaflavin-dependent oxidoreductase (nitroreductase family)